MRGDASENSDSSNYTSTDLVHMTGKTSIERLVVVVTASLGDKH